MTLNVQLASLAPDALLDPAFLRLTTEYTYLQNVGINLVEIDKDGNYQNQLADNIKTNPKGDIFTIKIKKALFSNGEIITIQDVSKSIKRAILLGTPHFKAKDIFRGGEELQSLDDNIEGIEIVDEMTIVFKLNNSMKEFYYYLQLTDLTILHESQYLKSKLLVKDWEKVTSGPYRISFEKNQTILVANEKALNYSEKMVKKIFFYKPKRIEDLLEKLKKKEMHFGEMSPIEYLNIKGELDNISSLKIFGSKTDGINIIALNVKNKKFQSEHTRRWILKKILTSFELSKKQSTIMKKSFQFFLPNAKGYLKNESVIELLDSIDLAKIPEELKSGITISALTGMKRYLVSDLEEKLSDILKIRVTINTTLSSEEYAKTLKKRDYEAISIAISMSYKVLGETLNFQYLREGSIFQDPTGKVKKLLKKYQDHETQGSDIEYQIIKKIMEQMTLDAESIPLYYYMSPTFFFSDEIDISELFIEEALQFWRIRVKE